MSKKAWRHFISAEGLQDLIPTIEKLKQELKRRIRRKGKDFRWYLNTIRLEHLQIRKHQKIALKYLQELEEKMAEYEIKYEIRDNFKKTYKVK